MNKNFSEKFLQAKYLLPIIVILAVTVRIIFFMGNVFSDDAYYSRLAISFLDGNYPGDFIGYPIHLARKLITALTAAGFAIFGKSEVGSIAFPFLFSILSIPLIYAIAKELFDNRIALTAAFLLAIFPTDVIFATLNFADLIAAFFINFGIYYLILYMKTSESKYSFFAGMYFAISIFAKMNFYYIGILLVVLIIYRFIKTHKLDQGLVVSLIIPFFMLFLESMIYGTRTGDYLYRLHLVEQNYQYTYYNFFPFTILGIHYTFGEYVAGVFQQVFVQNLPGILFRRFYLFIPLLAVVQSFLLIRLTEKREIVFWFLGLVILFAAFTSSPLSYRPLDLKFSWYIFPIFLPAIILAASFINRFSMKFQLLYLIAIFAASIFMGIQYQEYFAIHQKNEFKDFIKEHKSEIIFTDHHTKYGIDLIDGYPQLSRTKSVTDKDWSNSNIPPNSIVIYNPNVVNELVKQGHKLNLFTELFSDKFELVNVIAGFEIYKKLGGGT